MIESKQIEIIDGTETQWDQVEPNFIYNRFDLFEDDVHLITINNKYIPLHICYDTGVAHLGVWEKKLSWMEFQYICRFIFDEFHDVNFIRAKRVDITDYKLKNLVNDYYICLPKSTHELSDRLTSKERYNLRRSSKLLEAYCNGKKQILEYDDTKTEFFDLISLYFKLKYITHKKDYHLSPAQYKNKYHVSNIYALKYGEKTVSILLSCEQCSSVYLENFSYDTNYSKYSPGRLIYDYYLKILVNKGKERLYLKGGNLSYKKHYRSIENYVADLKISRSEFKDILIL